MAIRTWSTKKFQQSYTPVYTCTIAMFHQIFYSAYSSFSLVCRMIITEEKFREIPKSLQTVPNLLETKLQPLSECMWKGTPCSQNTSSKLCMAVLALKSTHFFTTINLVKGSYMIRNKEPSDSKLSSARLCQGFVGMSRSKCLAVCLIL